MLQRVHREDAGAPDQVGSRLCDAVAAPMTDGILILDVHGKARFCNAVFGDLLQLAFHEINGCDIENLVESASCADFRTRCQNHGSADSDPYMIKWQRADGTCLSLPTRSWPLVDADGYADGTVLLIVDETAQQKRSDELEAAQFLLDQTAIVLYRARMEEGLPLEYVSGNVEHFGYTAEQLKSGVVRFEDVVHVDDRRRVLAELYAHIARGDREFSQHYRVVTAHGETMWVEDQTYVREFADGAGIYLEGVITDISERRRAQDHLRQALTQTIGAIAATIDKRDPYTAGHQRRVADLAHAIARHLGLHADQAEGVYLGALVHDVGKIAIPVDILARPGRLSAEEFALVKTHVPAGVAVLRDVAFPWPIVDMVAQHHERLDGSGYPLGLSGDAILTEARIIAVADVFESMSTHRPYRAALPADTAREELTRGRSIRFDADAVDACLAITHAHGNDSAAMWVSLESGRPTAIPASVEPVAKIDAARD